MEQLHVAIKKGKYDFQNEVISDEAKDLISKLICVNK